MALESIIWFTQPNDYGKYKSSAQPTPAHLIGDQRRANCQTESASWASAWEQREKSPWILRRLDGGFPVLEICLWGCLSLSLPWPAAVCLVSTISILNHPPLHFVHALGEADSNSEFQGWAYGQGLVNELSYNDWCRDGPCPEVGQLKSNPGSFWNHWERGVLLSSVTGRW